MVEVVVVGDGPAGCAAALTLCTAGVSTTVIASGRPRQRPTETAVPQLGQLLRRLRAEDALAACEPCYGIESDWGAAEPVLRPSIFEPTGHAWFIHRARFDALLVQLASAAGTVRLEAEATHVSFVDDRIIVDTTAGPVEAKNLVIATGSPAWVARATGQRTVTMDSLICYWAQLAVPIESRLLHVETAANGWWYVCPGEASTTLACFLTDAEGSRQIARSGAALWNVLFHDTRLYRQYFFNARAEQIHCLPVNVAAVGCRCGFQWVAVGDAAIKLDPVGSSGTATALESGVLGARALLASRQGNKAVAERYDGWGNGLLAEFLKQRSPFYVEEARKYPDGFWARRVSSCLGFDAEQLRNSSSPASLDRHLISRS